MSLWDAIENWKNQEYFLAKYGKLIIPTNALIGDNETLYTTHTGPKDDMTSDASGGTEMEKYVEILGSSARSGTKPFLFQMTRAKYSLIPNFADDMDNGIFTENVPEDEKSAQDNAPRRHHSDVHLGWILPPNIHLY